MNIGDYVNELVIAGGGVAASLMAWKQGGKQVKANHLDNVDKAIKIWEDTSTKLSESLDNVEAELAKLKENHNECERTKRELEHRVKCLDEDVCVMKEALNSMGK